MSETKEERHTRIMARFTKNKFSMNTEGAIEASRNGLCGRCGEPRTTDEHDTTIFYRTTWGPMGMPMSEQGHDVKIHLCEDCYVYDLKDKMFGLECSISNTLNSIDFYGKRIEEILDKRNV